MIRLFSAIHGTVPFAADAEIFGDLLVTMDSFSAAEDFFTATPPETIGHNMAAAVLSDLLACGIKGEFLINTWNIDSNLPESFYTRCARGIQKVLSHYGVRCIGGDMGCSKPWSWCAAAGGKLTIPAPIRRIASEKIPFDLYASGAFGDANFAAFNKLPMPEIELRSPVPANAIFATDSSGGFVDALENFRRVNPDLTLHLEAIPLAPLPELPFPKEFLLIGGVGEYELIYAMPKGEKAPGQLIGHGDFSNKGIRFPKGKRMTAPPPDYREIPAEKWVDATENYYREFFL